MPKLQQIPDEKVGATLSLGKKLRSDIESSIGAGSYHKGIQALRAPDRRKVTVAGTTLGSSDVDLSLKKKHPTAARWDYVVGMQRTTKSAELVWIEVHPATSGANVKEMENKMTWLIGWLKAPLTNYQKKIVWISSGKTSFNARSPQIKRLASQGCDLVGGHYILN
ncbi:MAG TPA: hypothetical protein VMI56_15880 [Reyranella sp.]|nr:hypothetical protein [Reyranella sp.]